MLNNTYTLTDGVTSLVYTKLFPDANRSLFAVAGLAANAAKTLSVQHQTAKKSSRTLVSLDNVCVDPSSSTGATDTNRVYMVIQTPDFVTPAESALLVTRFVDLLAEVGFVDAVINHEV